MGFRSLLGPVAELECASGEALSRRRVAWRRSALLPPASFAEAFAADDVDEAAALAPGRARRSRSLEHDHRIRCSRLGRSLEFFGFAVRENHHFAPSPALSGPHRRAGNRGRSATAPDAPAANYGGGAEGFASACSPRSSHVAVSHATEAPANRSVAAWIFCPLLRGVGSGLFPPPKRRGIAQNSPRVVDGSLGCFLLPYMKSRRPVAKTPPSHSR